MNEQSETKQTNEENLSSCSVNPNAWEHCIAWSQVPGCNYACFEMCSPKQREACKTNGNAKLRG